ncbi:hypothetical protein TanjilG_27355 [Lupinus angustifolius]|uniref:Uncharacterized protein n=1 Tax=Lupinus angustifolius TaxID=3871 RepID=A0A394DCF1_LUPAN|nr:hypothetical protein TanjilG_27355 [Lupinus angustifolius]
MPPILLTNEIDPVPANGSDSQCFKKGATEIGFMREPLSDITNLFDQLSNPQIVVTPPSFASVTVQPNFRNKTASNVVCDSTHRVCSKILRMGFR